jgi:hypothetical protein
MGRLETENEVDDEAQGSERERRNPAVWRSVPIPKIVGGCQLPSHFLWNRNQTKPSKDFLSGDLGGGVVYLSRARVLFTGAMHWLR